jgi:selenide,water dikinase
MDGALDLSQRGVRSSLFADNRNDARVTAPDTPRAALMFDPQTGGGLLAAVPKDMADTLTDDRFTIIGEITDGSGVTFS